MLRSTHVSIGLPCVDGAAISSIIDRLSWLPPRPRKEMLREAPFTPHCHQQPPGTMPYNSTVQAAWRVDAETASHPQKKIHLARSRALRSKTGPTAHLDNEPARRDLRYTVDGLEPSGRWVQPGRPRTCGRRVKHAG